MRFLAPLLIFALVAAGCACGSNAPATATYAQNANGAVSPTVRAAMDPRTDSGPQEIIGINIPGQPFGIPFAFKAGVLYDGAPLVITWPNQPTTQAVGLQPSACGQNVVMLPQTEMVEERRVVPKTTLTPHVLVPVPQTDPKSGCR